MHKQERSESEAAELRGCRVEVRYCAAEREPTVLVALALHGFAGKVLILDSVLPSNCVEEKVYMMSTAKGVNG